MNTELISKEDFDKLYKMRTDFIEYCILAKRTAIITLILYALASAITIFYVKDNLTFIILNILIWLDIFLRNKARKKRQQKISDFEIYLAKKGIRDSK